MAGPKKRKGPKQRRGIEGLPSEILLAVVKNLDCARDLSSLARTSKTIQRVVDSSSAWQDFVRMKFPCTTIPVKTGNHDWKGLAESLTYQSRRWDRRSIRFTGMYPAQQTRSSRGLAFQPVIDVDYDMKSGTEIVVWGAGEDIVARYRQRGKGQRAQGSVSWRQLFGGQHGLRAGIDDVNTMNVVKLPHLKAPAILVGRENGDLSLLSAQANHNFGQQLANFSPAHPGGPVIAAEGDEPLQQQQIRSVDILNGNNEGLVAACSNLGVSIYLLPKDNNTTAIPPAEVYDAPFMATQQVWNAKWMGSSSLLALATRGTDDPLRYLTITPSGWRVEAAAKNARVVEEFKLTGTSMFANSIQPVNRYPGMTGATPLLLSTWRDGTVRLQDIRTPSPFDVVYQDNVQPFCQLGSLLVYDGERFVAGDMQSSMIKIFDFRWPKAYYHTTGLSCGWQYPFRLVEQRFHRPPPDNTLGRACCDHLLGLRCHWHELSRDVYYRPNALYMLKQSLPSSFRSARVNSLAKASDVSPNFYIGITGGIIEATLGAIDTEEIDPHLGFPDYKASSSSHPSNYLSSPMSATMMEVGDGLRSVSNEANILMPTVHSRVRETDKFERRMLETIKVLRKKHRLDESFHKIDDFCQDFEGVAYLTHKLGLD